MTRKIDKRACRKFAIPELEFNLNEGILHVERCPYIIRTAVSVSWYSISIRVRTFWRAVSSPVGSFSKDGMILPLFPLEKMPVQHGNAHHLII